MKAMNKGRSIRAILALAAMLLLTCAGCGGKEASAPPAPAESRTEEPSGQKPKAQPPETTQPKAGDAGDTAIYAAVLDEVCDVLYNGFSEESDYAYVPSGVMELARWDTPETRLDKVGYLIEDISFDGAPELLIGDAEDENGWIYGGYTRKGDEIVPFLDGWSRNRYRWLGEGRFYNAGSGGAMYSAFGTFHISPDGTELVCEDFYFTSETFGGGEQIGLYHNKTGEWDTAVSEEFAGSEGDFWALSERYESQCLRLELTPFSAREYTGYVSQPLDCAIRVDYLEDVWLSDYEDASGLIAADAEYETTVVFQPKRDVAEFRLLALELADVDDSGHAVFNTAELLYRPELKTPLAIPMSFPGDIPSNGFSYTDAAGEVRQYALGMSGRDGSLVVTRLD